MDINEIIRLLYNYKALGAKRVLLSVYGAAPPVEPALSYLPITDSGIVYIYAPESDDPESKTYPVIVECQQLQGLDLNGRPCEQCGRAIQVHAWAALDAQGFVLNCSIQQHAYARQLRREETIKLRAQHVDAADVHKDYQ